MDRPIATIKRTKEIQEKYNVFTKKAMGKTLSLNHGWLRKLRMRL